MNNILIIYPHWPPANLAGVHRARLISNFLPDFGWHPIVLTVNEKFYEEKLDYDILKTVRPTTEIIKVEANPVKSSTRFIGDIAIRAFSQLKEKAIQLIKERDIDFLWVPIPSFYAAIIARQVHEATKVHYGIDYIDPWVNSFVGQKKTFSKAWLSNAVAKIAEPYSVKKASLISGVSTPYYQAVLDRNFKNKTIEHVGMPYGFDPNDHKVQLDNVPPLWSGDIEAYVYAGMFLPKSHLFLKNLFEVISALKKESKWDLRKKLYFIGTGSYPGKQISDYAADFNITDIVVEINERKPFLHILHYLNIAKGIIVIGSVEEHYTASKIFQSLLSKRPVFAIFHYKSTVVNILKNAKADQYLVNYYEKEGGLKKSIVESFESFLEVSDDSWNPDLKSLDQYSAIESARALVNSITKVISK